MKWFQRFRLDPVNQCLWEGDGRLTLMPKPFAVLQYLVDHHGRLVTQEELLGAIWPDTYVQPEVLRKYILEIRRVLGDQAADPRFIQTFPKRGYQFIAEVRDAAAERARGREPGPALVAPGHRLVGRHDALERLRGWLGEASRGHRRIVFVAGEAGVGKTALVDAFVRSMPSGSEPRPCLARGQSIEGFGGKEPYYPVLEAVGEVIRTEAGRSLVEALTTHAPTWVVQLPSLADAERRTALRHEIFGATTERMVRELCEAIEAVTGLTLVLVLEDLHWADRPTLDVVSALARRRGPANLLVLGTYRPVEAVLSDSPLKTLAHDLTLHGLAHELAVERLERADVHQYLARELNNGDLAAALSPLVHELSDGNPLFMSAMLRHLKETGAVAPDGDRWSLTVALERLDPLPDTLTRMIDARLDDLDKTDLRLLRAASVAGVRFTTGHLAAMLDTGVAAVEERCSGLAGQEQVLSPLGTREEPDGRLAVEYEFVHALYARVLYRRLQPTERAAWHGRLARAFARHAGSAPASALAFHFEHAGEQTQAVRYLIDAALSASRRYAHAEAIQLLQHARELILKIDALERPALETLLLQHIGDIEYARGDAVRSVDAYEMSAAAAAQAGLATEEVRSLVRLAHPAALFDPERCIASCDRAARIAGAQGDEALAARARLLASGWRILFDGWTAEQSAVRSAALETIQRRGDALPAHEQILLANVLFLESDYARAAAYAESGLRQLVETDGLWEHVAGLAAKVIALLHMGQLGEARRALLAGIDLATTNGNAPWRGILRLVLASLHLQAFDFEGVREIADEMRATDSPGSSGLAQTPASVIRGMAELALGNHALALRYFATHADHEAQPRFTLHWYWRTMAQLGRADAHLASGQVSAARREIDALVSHTATSPDDAVRGLILDAEARVAIAEDRLRDADASIIRAFDALHLDVIPIIAWRVHATAWRLYDRMERPSRARRHRLRAGALLTQLADSLDGDPLREAMLAAPVVRSITGGGRAARR